MSRPHRSRRSLKVQWNLDRKSRQCDQKEAFTDEASAEARIDGLRKAGKARETAAWVLHVYGPCDKCGHWHVGHYMPKFEGGTT